MPMGPPRASFRGTRGPPKVQSCSKPHSVTLETVKGELLRLSIISGFFYYDHGPPWGPFLGVQEGPPKSKIKSCSKPHSVTLVTVKGEILRLSIISIFLLCPWAPRGPFLGVREGPPKSKIKSCSKPHSVTLETV